MALLHKCALLASSLAWVSLAENCSDDAHCPDGGICCNWDHQEVGYATGECGELCASNAPTACASQADCSEGHTCCSWAASLGKNTQGVCGEICALAAFESPQNCTADADCTEDEKSCCSWDSDEGIHTNGVCGEVCLMNYEAPEDVEPTPTDAEPTPAGTDPTPAADPTPTAQPGDVSGSWRRSGVVTVITAVSLVWRSAV